MWGCMGMLMLVAPNGQGMVHLACSRLIVRQWWRMRGSLVMVRMVLVLRHVGHRHWYPSWSW